MRLSVSGRGGWLLRRAVVAPLMPVLAAAAVGAWVPVAAGNAVIGAGCAVAGRGRPRWRGVRVSTYAVVYLVGETVCVVGCLGLWAAAGLGHHLDAPWAVAAHAGMLEAFLTLLVRAARPVFGFELQIEEPADHRWADGEAPVIVLARHAGPGASFVLVQTLIERYHRLPRVVLKEQLRWDPAIDLLLTRTGCTWVGRHEGADPLGAAAAALGPKEALVLYPEGADWTPVRHLAAVARLRGRGRLREARQALRMPHVLPPRPAGALAALQAAPDADVLIFTHTGHDELLDAASTWRALPLRNPLRMTWWRAPAGSVPRADADGVAAWLQRTWVDIDTWIGARTA